MAIPDKFERQKSEIYKNITEITEITVYGFPFVAEEKKHYAI